MHWSSANENKLEKCWNLFCRRYVVNAEKKPQTSNQFSNTQIIPICRIFFDWNRGNPKGISIQILLIVFNCARMNRKARRERRRTFQLHSRRRENEINEIFHHIAMFEFIRWFGRCKFNAKTDEIWSDRKLFFVWNSHLKLRLCIIQRAESVTFTNSVQCKDFRCECPIQLHSTLWKAEGLSSDCIN